MIFFLENFEIIDFMISSISFADCSLAIGPSEDQTHKLISINSVRIYIKTKVNL